jgi:hypothetical protein
VCPVGDSGAYCDAADCQCHTGCKQQTDCPAGKACFNNVCVGVGALRFTIKWDVDTDVDLHVLTSLGNEINFSNRSADGGVLDVDACISTCARGGVESVFFAHPELGPYEVWAVNYDGRKAAGFQLSIVDATGPVTFVRNERSFVAASDGASSPHFRWVVRPAGAP